MAVLKFKDVMGNWHSIPAIQGASAYEQAVDGGYMGTLEDFYLALNEVNAAVQAAGDAEDSASAAAASAAQLAAGVASPAGTYATTAALASTNPDHSKIYVVTADGHWYYWSGSAWADGGVYQAVSPIYDLMFDIKDTLQTPTFNGGRLTQIAHTNRSTSAVVRTDVFTYGPGTVTETRTLAGGASISFVNNLTTYATEVV
jgi:hypothetical protein